MTEGIDISHGGVIAVDTAILRGTLAEFAQARRVLDKAARRVRYLARQVWAAPGPRMLRIFGPSTEPTTRALYAHADTMDGAVAALGATAAKVLLMAEAYELVERRMQLAMLTAEQAPTAGVQRSELAAWEREHTEAVELADELTAAWEDSRFAGFAAQAWGLWPFGLGAVLAVHAGLKGLERATTEIGAGTRRRGAPGPSAWVPPMRVVTQSRGAAEPPQTLVDAISRIPAEDAQVRVERYSFPDGTRQFAVYVAGTRALGGAEPWNMPSNIELYFGASGASYEATRQALSDAGALPGDTVHAVGYSQGGMIAGYLATAGEFHVPTLVTAGSPTAPDVGAGTLSVQLRHTDDLVSLLAGGGRPDGVGSPDSVVVTRRADPASGFHDFAGEAHRRTHYLDTTRLFEESGDPRVAALDPLWGRLAQATSVEVTESTAHLLEPDAEAGSPVSGAASSSGGGGSLRRPH